uniref:Melanoregulin n=1 Tax=Equus asinus TaxID=9793 RepID=A0A9L0IN17_EQUAS
WYVRRRTISFWTAVDRRAVCHPWPWASCLCLGESHPTHPSGTPESICLLQTPGQCAFLQLHTVTLILIATSDNSPYSSFGATLARDDEQNLWSTPRDVSHTEADDDRVLYNLIVVRNQQAKDSEEWQKLNYDIYTLRQIRREVRNRWKRILEDLGFQKEADSLLSVTKLSTISDSKNTGKAREILLKLAEETNIFPTGWELSERYLFVVDRLIALDAAEEFFKIASRTYPKKPGAPCLADGQKGLHYLPFPSP